MSLILNQYSHLHRKSGLTSKSVSFVNPPHSLKKNIEFIMEDHNQFNVADFVVFGGMCCSWWLFHNLLKTD